MTTTLFRLRLLHDYYQHHIWQDCGLLPDPASQQLIQRFRLHTVMNNGEFCLYSWQIGSRQAFLHYLVQQLDNQPFAFWLQAEPAYFFHITNVPWNWTGQITFSSNDLTGSTSLAELQPHFSPKTLYVANILGVVHIYPQDLLRSGEEIARYSIKFQARQLHWRYYVVNRSHILLQNPVIKNHTGIEFEPPEACILPDGQDALLFSSGQQQFALEQRPSVKLNLVNCFNSQFTAKPIENCLIKGLPTPRNDQLKNKDVNGKHYVYSEMYVYL